MNISTAHLLQAARSRAAAWLQHPFPAPIKHATQTLLTAAATDDTAAQQALLQQFGSILNFGTGGIRAQMGLGTAAINEYTIAMLSQGLANYYLQQITAPLSAVIAYDSRHNSQTFANITAKVLAANGITTYCFRHARPTPQLAYAVRTLKTAVGIVITASHNPAIYNGYKVYNEQGCQLSATAALALAASMEQVTQLAAVKQNPAIIHNVPQTLDKAYQQAVLNALPPLVQTEAAARARQMLHICYSPLYGTGITVIPQCLQAAGFTSLKLVTAESKLNGAFPGLPAPNPEESAALSRGTETLLKTKSDILFATDADCDRVGLVLRQAPTAKTAQTPSVVRLNGNQLALILTHTVLTKLKTANVLPKHAFIANTIVTTPLMAAIGHAFGVPCYQTFTGFKYIGELITQYAAKHQFILGAEESHGYLIGTYVHDKDAAGATILLAEAAAQTKAEGRTLIELLTTIYRQYGYAQEELFALTLTGHSGMERIAKLMQRFRQTPPPNIGGAAVTACHDFLPTSSTRQPPYPSNATAAVRALYTDAPPLPQGNDVLRFTLSNHTQFIIRPSGTEPKLKFYLTATAELPAGSCLVKLQTKLEAKLHNLKNALNELCCAL